MRLLMQRGDEKVEVFFRVVLVNFLQLVVEIILQVLALLLWLGLR